MSYTRGLVIAPTTRGRNPPPKTREEFFCVPSIAVGFRSLLRGRLYRLQGSVAHTTRQRQAQTVHFPTPLSSPYDVFGYRPNTRHYVVIRQTKLFSTRSSFSLPVYQRVFFIYFFFQQPKNITRCNNIITRSDVGGNLSA